MDERISRVLEKMKEKGIICIMYQIQDSKKYGSVTWMTRSVF